MNFCSLASQGYPGPTSYNSGFGSANSYAGASAGAGAGGPVAQYPMGGVNPADFFNQYFAAMRAQQEAFQQQLQAMFQNQNA